MDLDAIRCVVEQGVLRCESTAPAPTLWPEFIKPILSTAAGALLAFFATKSHDRARLRRERLAAGNLALFTLKNQYREVLSFRLSVYKDLARAGSEEKPFWDIHRPVAGAFGNYRVNFDALTFLFEKAGRLSLFDRVQECESLAIDVEETSKFRNEIMVEIQRETAKFEQSMRGEPYTADDVEKHLGPYLCETATFILRGVSWRALSDFDTKFRGAIADLRQALIEELTPWWAHGITKIFPAMRTSLRSPPLISPNEQPRQYLKENLPSVSQRMLARLFPKKAEGNSSN